MACHQETSEDGTPQHRKITNLVIRKLVKKEKCLARSVFLRKCLKSKVIPNSLIVKPQTCEYLQTANKYKMCAATASNNNLRIALKDATAKAHEECTSYKEFLTSSLEKLNASDRHCLNKHLEKCKPQISNKLKLQFHQKLQHLKRKQLDHQPVNKPDTVTTDTTDTTGYKAPDKPFKKNRRFIKRNKYRKWKSREAQNKVNLVTNLSDFELTDSMNKRAMAL